MSIDPALEDRLEAIRDMTLLECRNDPCEITWLVGAYRDALDEIANGRDLQVIATLQREVRDTRHVIEKMREEQTELREQRDTTLARLVECRRLLDVAMTYVEPPSADEPDIAELFTDYQVYSGRRLVDHEPAAADCDCGSTTGEHAGYCPGRCV